MKIAILSDTHNNLKNIKKVIDWINDQNIELALHCGDIQGKETMQYMDKLFKGEIKYAKGNADWDMDIPEKVEVEVDNKKIAFCHFPDLAKQLSQSQKYDLVFYGHTHRPWDEKIGKTHMVNSGEVAGQFYKPCFAIYDTAEEKLELKILEKI